MAARSQGEITVTSHPFLAQELTAATQAIRNECGWHIAEQETITRTLRRRTPGWLWIPAMQVVELSAATADGVEVLLDSAWVDFETGETNLWGSYFSVTYVAGHEVVPADLVTLTLELAAGAMGVSLGIVREQAGGVAVTYAGGSASDDAHKDRLSAYKLGPVP
jgi:hypothetical protein